MRRLVALRAAAVVLVLLGVVVWFGGPAGADAPIKQGWWSRWQTEPLPVISLTVPTPPTGQPGGLTIARDGTQATAIAALYFQVMPGSDATLYLAAGDPTGVRLPPDAVVHACPATKDWQGELNGTWADAPTWSDDFCEPATVVAGEAGLIWSLPSTLQDDDGVFDIVIVPRGPVPYMVDFGATGEQTLVADEAPEETTTTTSSSTTTTTVSPTTATTEPIVEETDPIVTTIIGGGGGSGVGMPVVTTTPPTTPTSLVAFGPRRSGGLPLIPFPDTRAERIMAVSLLFFMAVALWWMGGNPARMPRLIGALAGDGAAVVPPAAPRGVGRFARPRDAMRPPRL